MAQHFGRKVVGDEAFDRAIREEKGGGSVFGTRVRDAIPDNNTMNIAKRATEMGVRVVNEVTPQDHRGETKDGGSISIEDLRNILAENPTFFDSLYEGELAREDGPRDDALRIFQEIERGIKGAGREVVLAEIRALLGETAITAGQKADLAQAHREQMLRQLKRQDENNQLIDADRVQALRDRAEALDAIKASDSEGSKEQIISPNVESQTAHIGRELGLDIPGTGTGKPTPGTVPAKPDGDVHPGTQQPGSRALVPKSGPGAEGDTDGAGGASKGAEDSESDYDSMTKAELQDEADRLGIEEIKGTGADGAIVKDDLLKAVKKAARKQSK